MNPESRAAKVRMLVLDVDGVLTDGGLYYDAEGRILKRFNVQDGLGIKVAQRADIQIAVISGLDSLAVATRVKELGITYYYPGHHHKIPVLKKISKKSGIDLSAMAYLGDDWVDVGPMENVGLPMAVANAQPEILNLAAWTSRARGGHGAVREAIRFLLESQGKLEKIWRTWAD
ncbi:MAG: HAD hydrolase family protein [Desulfoplanes sp.]|nr:HAD hydrolase family protein [Desulfoplanes sp.]MDD4648836.1 HAD hydrolase family protein [Desulfoplanes sp.]